MIKIASFFFIFCFELIITGLSSSVFAATYSAENNPEYNLNIRTYNRSSGSLGLIDFKHEGDPTGIPPQLCTLLEGNFSPNITSLYQIHEYDWNNNKPSSDYVSVPDLLSEYASLVGLETTPGQNILVPNSGYDIGQGYQVTVLYASSDQITLRYAIQDDMFSGGYGIHILGLNVDPNLLSQYQQAAAQGRSSLPALKGEEILGTASGNEVLVAIRDSGSFMDPRWKNDWWYECSSTSGKPFSNGSIKVEEGLPPGSPSSCSLATQTDSSSRPAPCSFCNRGSTVSDCATTFSVNDTVKINKGDGSACGGDYYVEKSWGGSVNVNPANVSIPFVGKQGQEDETKYLADYFEGTDEYYRKYPDGSAYWLDKVNFAGVNRKLTPMEYQNNLKNNVLNRAVQTTNNTITSNPVFDYKIKYQSRICWDFPFITDLTLAILEKMKFPLVSDMSKYTHYCLLTNNPANTIKAGYGQNAIIAYNLLPFVPFKINFERVYWEKEATLTEMAKHQPPKPTDPNYEKAWTDWANQDKAIFEKYGKWFYLWSAVPLSTREDTQGRITSQASLKSKDTYNIDKNSFMQTFTSVPHVARLFEQSLIAQKMLKNSPVSVLGEETTLLAQGSAGSIGVDIQAESYEEPQLKVAVSFVNNNCTDIGHIQLYLNGNPITGIRNWDRYPEPFRWSSQWTGSPFNLGRGQSITLTYSADTDSGNCMGQRFSSSCTFSVNSNGKMTSTCGQVPTPPPGPACGLAPAPNISNCEKPAITDPNPNDKLCCNGTLKANLAAVDQVINPDYSPCIETLPDGTVRYNNDCFTPIDIPVSRRVAVNLNQPYLKQIWDATAAPLTGVFNLFRPSTLPAYSPIEAKSKEKVSYEYDNGKGTGTATAGEGDFYFPYLGGIEQAKEQTVKGLMPYGFK